MCWMTNWQQRKREEESAETFTFYLLFKVNGYSSRWIQFNGINRSTCSFIQIKPGYMRVCFVCCSKFGNDFTCNLFITQLESYFLLFFLFFSIWTLIKCVIHTQIFTNSILSSLYISFLLHSFCVLCARVCAFA